jgi:hypothetical protein
VTVVSDHNSLSAERNLEKAMLQRGDPYNTRYIEEREYYEKIGVARPVPPGRHDREKAARK